MLERAEFCAEAPCGLASESITLAQRASAISVSSNLVVLSVMGVRISHHSVQ